MDNDSTLKNLQKICSTEAKIDNKNYILDMF